MVRPVNRILSGLGVLVLLAGTAVGLALAVDLPDMIAGGVFDRGLAREIEDSLGMADWPRLAGELGTAVTAVLVGLAVILLILARRKAGAAHIFRVIPGSVGLVLAMLTFGEAFDHIGWPRIADDLNAGRIGPAIDIITRNADGWVGLFGLVLLLVSIMILVWPARRLPVPGASHSSGGHE